ncbi:MAG: hypothetical protein F6K16_33600 [Symploca sp. SIO2B6]|nr:hypothetical protein [Symploca sp. SIO2B6]
MMTGFRLYALRLPIMGDRSHQCFVELVTIFDPNATLRCWVVLHPANIVLPHLAHGSEIDSIFREEECHSTDQLL